MSPEILRLRGCVVDLARRRVLRGAETVALTTKEAELLAYLAARPNRTIERARLHSDIWGHAPGAASRAADDTVRRLRPKIEVDPDTPDHVLTVHGKGYRFDPMMVATDDPGADDDFGFPRFRTAFVGRDDLLRAVTDQLGGGARWITLFGPGGAGKTRIATQWGRPLGSRARFVDGSECRNATELCDHVARAYGPRPTAKDPVAATADLIQRSHDAPVLVLDNLEQVPDARTVIERWLGLVPTLTVLATSRVAFGGPFERTLAVGALEQANAVDLFVDRARAVSPSDGSHSQSDPAIALLVDSLDRLPLLIEMAAARSGTMSPSQIQARLHERFRLLRQKDGPERHSTLQTTLDWSWDIAQDDERRAIALLSIFGGPFDDDAAAAVIGPALQDHPSHAVLAKLIASSWLVIDSASGRKRMLLSIRDYAAARLTDRDLEAQALERHAQYYIDRLEPIALGGLTGSNRDAYRRIEEEQIELEAIVRRDTAKEPIRAARALTILSPLLEVQGIKRRILDMAEGLDDDRVPPALRARVVNAIAQARFGGFDLDGAMRDLARTAELFDQAGEHVRALRARGRIGVVLWAKGATEQAMAHLEAIEEEAIKAGQDEVVSSVLFDQGAVLATMGRTVEAAAAFSAAVSQRRDTNQPRALAMALTNLAIVDLDLGEEVQAKTLLDQALQNYQVVDDRGGIIIVLTQMAILSLRRREPERAVALINQADAVVRATHSTPEHGLLYALSAWSRLQLGRPAEARAEADFAVQLTERAGHKVLEIESRVIRVNGLVVMGALDEAEVELPRLDTLSQHAHTETPRLTVLILRGEIAYLRGQLDTATAALDQASTTARTRSDRRSEARALAMLALAQVRSGLVNSAVENVRALERLARVLDDARLRVDAAAALMLCATRQGSRLLLQEADNWTMGIPSDGLQRTRRLAAARVERRADEVGALLTGPPRPRPPMDWYLGVVDEQLRRVD